MQIALDVSTRATCRRRQVGAVIERERRILTTGYNGAPMGLAHCLDVGCHLVNGHCIRCLHAEQNAIIQAAYFGIATSGANLYCTHQPCNMCARMIVNAGIVKVVIGGEYPDHLALEVLNAAGVDLQYKPLLAKSTETDSTEGPEPLIAVLPGADNGSTNPAVAVADAHGKLS